MKRHKHKAIDGYQRESGEGLACHATKTDCPERGAHVTTHCKCGAVGVICPQHKYTFWHKEAR